MTRSLLSGTFIALLLCVGLFSQGASAQQNSIPGVISWDTTKAFHSVSTMAGMQMSSDSALRAWFKDKPEQKFEFDSLLYFGWDHFGVTLYKTLLKEEKSLQNFRWLRLMLTSSAFLGNDRVEALLSQYPKALRDGPEGKKVKELMHKHTHNEGRNIRQHFSSTMLTSLEGKSITLEKVLQGSPLYILAFGASWCSPCKYNDQLLHRAANNWDTSRFRIIHLSVDKDRKKWEASERSAGYERTSYLMQQSFSGALMKAMGINGVGRFIVINSQGDVIVDNISARIVIRLLEPELRRTGEHTFAMHSRDAMDMLPYNKVGW